MNCTGASRQRGGVAILLIVAAIALGGTYYLVSSMNEMSAQRKAYVQERNSAVLQRAKQALIGYMLARAQKGGATDPEQNPGALPCPEHAWHIAVTTEEGTAGPSVGVPNPGYGTANCASIGRFPWKTIGTEKLVDGSGEPLWYAVGPTWRKTSTASNTIINSNTAGDVTLDGQSVVALIIAPGPVQITQASTTPYGVACAARSQARTGAPTGNTLDPLDYLECYNSATLAFSSNASAASYNDQVVAITTADLIPGLEAAIAKRIERDIVPQLKAVYATNTWGANVSAANPVYPYPAPFANPGTTTSYRGSASSCAGNVCQGLLPMIFTNTPGSTTALCTPGGSSLCDPTFVAWASGTIEVKSLTVLGTTYNPGLIPGVATWVAPVTSCTVATDAGPPQFSRLDCSAYVPGVATLLTTGVTYEVKGIASNVAMALRQFNAAAALPGVTVASGPTVAMGSTGAATVTFTGTFATVTETNLVSTALCGLSGILLGTLQCRQVSIQVPLPPLFPDHALLNSNHTTWGWYTRNEWHRLTYYAVAQGNTATSLPTAPACTSGTTCLTIGNVTPSGQQRAMLILAGRSINGNARPTATLADYLEGGNATGSFERQTASAATGPVYTDTGAANNYAVGASVTTGTALRFLAVNANTGASTLSTATTGVRNVVDASGAALAAGTIKASSVVEVTYDGTRFVLSKRMFNDRIVVVDSNP